jgi:nucleoside-diphosphate-sugar epimerase
MNPVSLYARTKYHQKELSVPKAASACDYAYVDLYGYSPRMRFDLVVNTMTMTAFTEGKINVFGGNQWRPLLGLEDASDAYIKALESEPGGSGSSGTGVFTTSAQKSRYTITKLHSLAKGIKEASGKDIQVNVKAKVLMPGLPSFIQKNTERTEI